MKNNRKIERIITGQRTSDGARVKLTRILGHNTQELADPFLLLDFFGSGNPDDFMAGFPSHPHRGIETDTYMLDGKVEHSDSMGNRGMSSYRSKNLHDLGIGAKKRVNRAVDPAGIIIHAGAIGIFSA